MSLHKEVSFETEIRQHLAAYGWRYTEGDAANYDRAPALFPPVVLVWVQKTQPKAWEILTKNHGAQAGEVLLSSLVVDLYDSEKYEGSLNYYTPKRQLTPKNKLGPPAS